LRVFGRRLFERSEFPTAAQDLFKIEDEVAGGSLFFGFFLLATQKKETRLSGETDMFSKTSNASLHLSTCFNNAPCLDSRLRGNDVTINRIIHTPTV